MHAQTTSNLDHGEFGIRRNPIHPDNRVSAPNPSSFSDGIRLYVSVSSLFLFCLCMSSSSPTSQTREGRGQIESPSQKRLAEEEANANGRALLFDKHFRFLCGLKENRGTKQMVDLSTLGLGISGIVLVVVDISPHFCSRPPAFGTATDILLSTGDEERIGPETDARRHVERLAAVQIVGFCSSGCPF